MTQFIRPTDLTEAVAYVLERAGAQPDIAHEVAENLVEADLSGRSTHGTRLLGTYIQRLLSGQVKGDARPELEPGEGIFRRVRGNGAFGQVVAAFSVREGIRTARQHGIAVVTVSGASHLGRNGAWAEMAAEAGIVSMHFMNIPVSPSAIVPHGGRDARFTPNPFVFGAPHPDGAHVVSDFSVGAISGNAVKQSAERGKHLPFPCLLTPDGSLSDNPADFIERGYPMTGFGEHKGYAIAVLTEILAGILGSGQPHLGQTGKGVVNNIFSIYINPSALAPTDRYDEQMRALTGWITSSAPAAGVDAVRMPGDSSRAARLRNREQGLPLDSALLKTFASAATNVGLNDDFSRRWPQLRPA